jgi:hypothetical protein
VEEGLWVGGWGVLFDACECFLGEVGGESWGVDCYGYFGAMAWHVGMFFDDDSEGMVLGMSSLVMFTGA